MTSPEFEAALRKYMIDSWEASKREAETMRKQMAELMAAVSAKEEKASKKSKTEA